MRNLCAFLILSASRHILRIRRNRSDWRRAFVAQLVRVLVASAMLTAFCIVGAAI